MSTKNTDSHTSYQDKQLSASSPNEDEFMKSSNALKEKELDQESVFLTTEVKG